MPTNTSDERDYNQGYYGAESEYGVLKHDYAQCGKDCKLGTAASPCWWTQTEGG